MIKVISYSFSGFFLLFMLCNKLYGHGEWINGDFVKRTTPSLRVVKNYQIRYYNDAVFICAMAPKKDGNGEGLAVSSVSTN